MRIVLPLALLAALVGSSACTTRNPVTGRPEVVLMSEEQEKKIDEQMAKGVEAEMGLVHDDALNAYVDAIGQTLASHSPRPDMDYKFAVIEMDEPNAFALPGGHIYVSRGLLLLSNSEAELANVLAHEIGHVAARHAAQRDAHMKTMGVATLLGTLASGSSEGHGRSGKIGPGGFSAYSRSQESEADAIGQDLSVEAGIDPGGMSRFLRSLDSSTRLTQGFSQAPSYFATHPATPTRIVEAETSAQLRQWEPGFSIAPDRQDYLQRLEGLAIGRPASEGVLQGSQFLHADLDFTVRFPSSWEVHNQPSRVLALSPQNDAMLTLELEEKGNDPQSAARRYMEREDGPFGDAAPIRIGELDAFRTRGVIRTPAGAADADITWIAHGGNIYRLTGAALGSRLRRYTGIFRSYPRSFRPLREDERATISDLRLHLERAREGETLADLSERVENAWDLNRTAVFNAISIDTRLAAGQLVKVAVRRPYRPQPAAPPFDETEIETVPEEPTAAVETP